MRILKSNPILGLANSYIIDNPEPANISYMWNFGSLLGLCLVIQILTGIFLAMHYCPNVDLAFASVEHIMRDVNYGWAIRYVHANTASFFFLFMYFHVGRGLYYGSYKSPRILPWSIGVIILILTMATAFLGYVLPYGQMSLWGEEKYCPTCNYTNILAFLVHITYSSIIFIIIFLDTKNPNTKHYFAKRIRSEYRIGPHNKDILSIFMVLYLEIVMQKNEKKVMELVLVLVKNLIEKVILFGFILLFLRKDIVILLYLLFKVE